jgi:hypothetical protein
MPAAAIAASGGDLVTAVVAIVPAVIGGLIGRGIIRDAIVTTILTIEGSSFTLRRQSLLEDERWSGALQGLEIDEPETTSPYHPTILRVPCLRASCAGAELDLGAGLSPDELQFFLEQWRSARGGSAPPATVRR